MKIKLTPRNIFLCLLLPACGLSAQTALINFGGSSGTLSFGGSWNDITTLNGDLAAGSIVDTTGATIADWALTVDNFEGQLDNGGTWAAGDSGWVDADATEIVYFSDQLPVPSITFSGLDAAGFTYNVGLLVVRATAGPSPDRREADYSISGSFGDSTPSGDGFNAFIDGWTGGNTIAWNSLNADGSGNITIDTDILATGTVYAAGLYIEAVAIPEPSSVFAIASVGMLAGLLVWRRRK